MRFEPTHLLYIIQRDDTREVASSSSADLVNLRSGDNLINLLTRVILLVKPSSDIDKVKVLLISYNEAFC